MAVSSSRTDRLRGEERPLTKGTPSGSGLLETLRRRFPPLLRSFYLRHTLAVARDLPGCMLLCLHRGTLTGGRIVEVEAYGGQGDPASHSFRGRTARNGAMFLEGGHLYVYFVYGMHHCANVVTQGEGTGAAVLLRALEPLIGADLMRRRRGGGRVRDVARGPARLSRALGIGMRENGLDLCGGRIWITPPAPGSGARRVGCSVRVGITRGRDLPWRFFLQGSPWVSGRAGGASGRGG
ncbi:MAG: DNA-3-methyladenine glycosylase [Bacteroidota bacterium]